MVPLKKMTKSKPPAKQAEDIAQKLDENTTVNEEIFYKTKRDLARIVAVFELIGFREFVDFMNSPRKLFIRNFVGGIFRGFGIVVGMTIVVTMAVWILTQLVDFPLIGQYFQRLLDLLESSAPISVR
jgi:hypothetical protein